MKKIVVVMMMLVLLGSVSAWAGEISSAQPAPVEETETSSANLPIPANLPMIASTKALTSYAKERVAQASMFSGSAGPILPGGKTYVTVTLASQDIRQIADLLAKEKLSFRVLKPEVEQYLSASYCDENGLQLFYGSNSYRLEKGVDGTWPVPDWAKNIKLNLCQEVPIYVPGVNFAYANVGGRYVQINVWRNYVWFPTSLAGIAGQLIIGMMDGGGVSYDITSGEQSETVLIEASANVSVDNLVALDDPEVLYSLPTSVGGQGQNPLYQLVISDTRTIPLFGRTSEGELATGVYVRQVGTSELMYFDISIGALPFSAGTYDLWFVYPNFGQDEPVIPPSYDGGGMG